MPLSQLRTQVDAEVRLQGARLVGAPRAATVAGASGIRYDFVFVAGDGQVRGSQVVVDHGGDRYFVTYEARPGAFESRLSPACCAAGSGAEGTTSAGAGGHVRGRCSPEFMPSRVVSIAPGPARQPRRRSTHG